MTDDMNGVLRLPEGGSDLSYRTLFKKSHSDDAALVVGQAGQRGHDRYLGFVLGQVAAGRGLAGGDPKNEIGV